MYFSGYDLRFLSSMSFNGHDLTFQWSVCILMVMI